MLFAAFVVKLTISFNFTRFARRILSWHPSQLRTRCSDKGDMMPPPVEIEVIIDGAMRIVVEDLDGISFQQQEQTESR